MKLYTKTVCPKCMYAKTWINASDKKVEIINIEDDTTEAKEAYKMLKENDIMAVPVLDIGHALLVELNDIQEALLG